MALETITVNGSAFPAVLTLPVSTVIGGISVDAALEETHEDVLEVTEHPVEAGAQITDHSYKRAQECVLRVGWSNSSLNALGAIIDGLFSGGVMSANDYVHGVYSQLKSLQLTRQTFQLTTSLTTYHNMLMTSLRATRDPTTANALMVTATFREIIIVSTQSATIAPQANQMTPASTAEVQNVGSVSPQAAAAPTGGSFRGT